MAFNAKRLQVFAKVPMGYGAGDEMRLIEQHPALRLHGEGAEYPVFVQDGEVWAESGERMSPLPPWFWDEVRKCAPRALEAVGWTQVPPALPAQPDAMPARARIRTAKRLRKRFEEKATRTQVRIDVPGDGSVLGMVEELHGHDHSDD